MRLNNYLKEYRGEGNITSKSSISNERQDLIQQFLLKLNQQRDGFPPLTGRGVAMKLSHIPTHDLWGFYRQCDQANHFSKYFWWSLKTNNEQPTN